TLAGHSRPQPRDKQSSQPHAKADINSRTALSEAGALAAVDTQDLAGDERGLFEVHDRRGS
ncbi:hypothetical protein, partial [Kitasatospora sp. NPDC088779]|uniref:hypothetical protein n=1 Tax=Kitasatospora sp. NPDC088779 TaxID=3154964 RepID=UPI00343379E9